MFTYDGDTPQDARRAVRARANLVLTNPDMLHSGILPHHTKWATLFQNLRYVVIDELHAYRGVFGKPSRQRAAPPAADLPSLRLGAAVHHGLGDHRQSGRAGPPAHRASRSRRSPRAERPTGDKIFVCYNPPVVNRELGHPRAVSR